LLCSTSAAPNALKFPAPAPATTKISVKPCTARTTIEHSPFIAALSFLCSTELPSAAVSFLELPEKTPERAAKRLRFKPAYTFAMVDQ
jgi:hypothetical protein